MTYLEAKHPQPALLPAEPRARGRAVWFEEVADTVLIPAGAPIVVNRFLRPQIFGSDGDEDAAKAGEEAIGKPLAYLEGELGDGWLDGEFSVGDLAMACAIKTLSYAGWSPDPATYPKLAAWFDRVRERPAWQQAADEEDAIFASMRG